MTCVNGRADLSANDERQLFGEAGGFCQRCGQNLFLEIGKQIEEAHPHQEVVARRAASAPIRLFAEYGVLDDSATRDAFAAAGLVDA